MLQQTPLKHIIIWHWIALSSLCALLLYVVCCSVLYSQFADVEALLYVPELRDKLVQSGTRTTTPHAKQQSGRRGADPRQDLLVPFTKTPGYMSSL